jgi:hypothetical protein
MDPTENGPPVRATARRSLAEARRQSMAGAQPALRRSAS